MNIAVLLKQVPDLVEELEVDESGTGLDRSWLKFILNEFDDHALEQAILLKEQYGGQVKVFALDMGDVDDTLFTAIAKGADSAAKITGDLDLGVDSHTAARIFQAVMENHSCDLILTGVQAIDDLDGQIGPLLASYLGLPYVGVVSGVCLDPEARMATVKKEFPGGILAELKVKLPAVLGIQAASQPPRYVPVARIRQAMKSASIAEIPVAEESLCLATQAGINAGAAVGVTLQDGGNPVAALGVGLRLCRMFKPEDSGHAKMFSGSMPEIARRMADLLAEKGLVR